MKSHALFLLSLLLPGLSCTTQSLFSGSQERPNIIFIFSDDHATQAISAYGFPLAEYAPTPQIDRLADQGMRFDRCMVTNSICGPSRATILTGKYSHLNGFYVNEGTEFDGSQVTFPKLLQAQGYRTAILGKWHLGSEPTGFDHWEVLPGQGDYYNPDFRTPNGRVKHSGYVSEIITEKALTWLDSREDRDEPFLLMVQHKAPHREWSPPVKYLDLFDDIELPEPESLFSDHADMSEAARKQDMSIGITLEDDKDLKIAGGRKGGAFYRRVYSKLDDAQRAAWDDEIDSRIAAYEKVKDDPKELLRWKYQQYIKDYLSVVRTVDDSVGRILDYLDASGLSENTIVVYSSDQGFYLGEHGWFDKRFMYDESYRTPLLVKWPGVAEPGSVRSEIVSNLDFAQTFLDLAGAEQPSEMQGMSLLPLLKGEQPIDWRQYHYYHYYEFPGWHMVYRHEGIYDGRFKLIHYYDVDEWELLDTRENPLENENVYGEPKYADEVDRLKTALDELKTELQVPEGIPAPGDRDPFRYYSTGRKAIERPKAQ